MFKRYRGARPARPVFPNALVGIAPIGMAASWFIENSFFLILMRLSKIPCRFKAYGAHQASRERPVSRSVENGGGRLSALREAPSA